jgi:hypothetical protein
MNKSGKNAVSGSGQEPPVEKIGNKERAPVATQRSPATVGKSQAVGAVEKIKDPMLDFMTAEESAAYDRDQADIEADAASENKNAAPAAGADDDEDAEADKSQTSASANKRKRKKGIKERRGHPSGCARAEQELDIARIRRRQAPCEGVTPQGLGKRRGLRRGPE